MKHLKVKAWLAVLMVAAFASAAQAQGTITFDCGYPKGAGTGTISVSGKFTLDSGWTAVGTTGTLRIWQDGSVVSTTTIAWGGGGFSHGGISGFDSCKDYNVTFEITIIDSCCNTTTIITDPGRVTVP